MNPTKFLIGQIAVVFATVLLGVWSATQWCANMLGYQARLGLPRRSPPLCEAQRKKMAALRNDEQWLWC